VVAHVASLPDIDSTARRFDWSNLPPSAEDGSAGGVARRILEFNSDNYSQASAQLKMERASTATRAGLGTSQQCNLSR